MFTRGVWFFSLAFPLQKRNLESLQKSQPSFQVLQDRATQEHSGGVVGKSQWLLLLDNGTVRQLTGAPGLLKIRASGTTVRTFIHYIQTSIQLQDWQLHCQMLHLSKRNGIWFCKGQWLLGSISLFWGVFSSNFCFANSPWLSCMACHWGMGNGAVSLALLGEEGAARWVLCGAPWSLESEVMGYVVDEILPSYVKII